MSEEKIPSMMTKGLIQNKAVPCAQLVLTCKQISGAVMSVLDSHTENMESLIFEYCICDNEASLL